MYPIGTTLKVATGIPGITHYGIVVEGGDVVHRSKKRSKVVREPESVFADGGKVQVVQSITSDNPQATVDRAMRCIDAPYNLFVDNCEHFVRYTHGKVKESPQLQKWLFVSVGTTAVAKSNDPLMKGGGCGMIVGALLAPDDESLIKSAFVGGLVGVAISYLASNREHSDKM